MANFDYTNYNYQELIAEVQRVLAAASDNPAVWQDSYHSSTAQVIIQVIAAMTDNLHYMLERRSQENFLPTARLASSVGAIANLLGYRPRLTVSSSGTVQLILDVAAIEQIVIPKYASVTLGDKNFVTSDQSLILVGETVVDLEVFEGTVEFVEVDTTTGIITTNDTDKDVFYDLTSNFLLIKDYSDIENDSFLISSDAAQDFYDVTKADPSAVTVVPPIGALSFAQATDEVFDIRLSNDGLRVHFGDDEFGERPQGTLTVKWVKSSGQSVTVPSTGESFTMPDYPTLEDTALPTPNSYTYTILNTTAIDGALAPETVDQIKTHAPDFARTGNRAVTKHDFSYWTKQSAVGGIIDAAAYGEEETGITVFNANNVNVVYLQTDGTELSIAEKQELKDFLDIYKTITTLVIINPAVNVPLDIDVTVVQNPNLSLASSQVEDLVRSALDEFFEIQEGSIAKSAYHSEIVEHLQNYTAVDQTGISKNIARNVTVTVKALNILDLDGYGDQAADFVTVVVPANPTGIAVDATVYDFDCLFDGTTNINVNALGSQLTTFADVLTQINTQISGYGVARIKSDKIIIQSNTLGTASDVDITDNNWWSAMGGTLDASSSGGTNAIDTVIPIPVLAQPTVPVDFIYPTSVLLVDENGAAVASPGLQRVIYGDGITGADSTGISGTTPYSVDITVDGGGVQTVTAPANDLLTYAAVVNEINSQTTGLHCELLNGQFIIYSLVNGAGTSILIDDSGYGDKLFTDLDAFTSIEAAVPGLNTAADTPLTADVGYIGVGTINYKTGEMDMLKYLDNGRYYVKYSQDADQNFAASARQVLLFDNQVLTNDPLAPQILSTVTVVTA